MTKPPRGAFTYALTEKGNHTMATIEELRITAENTKLMRRAQTVLGYLAPMTAEPVTKLYDGTGFVTIPEDYIPVGLVSRENPYSFPSEAEWFEATSIGHSSPTRRDPTSATRTINYTAQETKRVNLEMAYGIDLSNQEQDADGEVGYAHPELPVTLERRLLVIAWDPKHGGWAMGRFYPHVETAEFPDITWGGDSLIEYETTLSAKMDDDLGYPLWEIPVAGPGALAAREALGFAAATP